MIYIIEAVSDGKSTFKIGTTKNCPYQRFAQLSRQNAIPLRLVAALMGDKSDEAKFHHVFRKWRLHSEWFSDCPGIRLLIQDFPISEWDRVTAALTWGEMEFAEAHALLTMLKFEPKPAA